MTDSNWPLREPIPLHGGAVAAILKLLDSQTLMTLGTNSPEGQPHLSTLGYANDGLNLYFITARGSEKRRNILADPRVAVAIRGRAEEGEAVGLSIEGRAAAVEDPAEIAALEARVEARTPQQAPFAPCSDDVVVVKVVPQILKAVAVVDGRSQAQTFSIGDPDRAIEGVSYSPSAVARLF